MDYEIGNDNNRGMVNNCLNNFVTHDWIIWTEIGEYYGQDGRLVEVNHLLRWFSLNIHQIGNSFIYEIQSQLPFRNKFIKWEIKCQPPPAEPLLEVVVEHCNIRRL